MVSSYDQSEPQRSERAGERCVAEGSHSTRWTRSLQQVGPCLWAQHLYSALENQLRLVRLQEFFAFLVEGFFRIKQDRMDRIMKLFKQNVYLFTLFFLCITWHQVTEQHIKPVTFRAGKMSWALMLNPDGLDCHLFISILAESNLLEWFGCVMIHQCLMQMRFFGRWMAYSFSGKASADWNFAASNRASFNIAMTCKNRREIPPLMDVDPTWCLHFEYVSNILRFWCFFNDVLWCFTRLWCFNVLMTSNPRPCLGGRDLRVPHQGKAFLATWYTPCMVLHVGKPTESEYRRAGTLGQRFNCMSCGISSDEHFIFAEQSIGTFNLIALKRYHAS